MTNALIDNLAYESEEMKFYLQEKLILDVTEEISELMERKEISKSELAKRLGRSKGYITQILNGRANMTLRTISDVMWALKSSVGICVHSLEFEGSCDSKETYDFSRFRIAFSNQTHQSKKTKGATQYKLVS